MHAPDFPERAHVGRRPLLLTLAVVLTCAIGLFVPSKPAAASPVTAATAVRKTGYLTVADGTRLKWTVLLPRSTGRFPVLMQYEG